MKRSVWRRRIVRALQIAGALFLLFVLVVVIDGWRAFGSAADGDRRARMERSKQWQDGVFENPQPLENSTWKMLTGSRRATTGRPTAPCRW